MAEQDRESVPHPTARYICHVVTKGLQAGAVIGSGIALVSCFRNKGSLTDSAMKNLTYSLLGGATLSTIKGTLGLVKYVGMDQEGLEDRAYRITYNDGMNRLDRLNAVFGIFGAGALGVIRGPDPYTAIAGFTLGTAAAVFAYAMTTEHKPHVDKMVHELRY